MATQIMGSSSELNTALAGGRDTSGLLGRLLGALREFRRYQRTISELEMLSDRELRDIGLNRCEIPETARRCSR